MNRKIIHSILTLFAFLWVGATAQEEDKKALLFDASYVGDFVNNLHGGIKTGSAYLGMVNLFVEFNTGKAGLWKGGTFATLLTNTHGAMPSKNLVGDAQGFSNIEAGNHTFVQTLWYKQKIGKLELTIGLQDLTVEFANFDYGNLYINSSFGTSPSITQNVPAPVFPLTSLGFTARWNVSEKFICLAAVYDDTPTNFKDDPYNLKWQLRKNNGYIFISEMQFNVGVGTYKAGILYSTHTEDDEAEDIVNLYLNANQQIWKQDERRLGIFLELGHTPTNAACCQSSASFGVNYKGLFNAKGKDEIGIAFSYEHYTAKGLKPETAIELTYKYCLLDQLYIQPNIQYIINPAGTGINLDNALLATIRFGIEF